MIATCPTITYTTEELINLIQNHLNEHTFKSAAKITSLIYKRNKDGVFAIVISLKEENKE